jgi:hypothetical protein
MIDNEQGHTQLRTARAVFAGLAFGVAIVLGVFAASDIGGEGGAAPLLWAAAVSITVGLLSSVWRASGRGAKARSAARLSTRRCCPRRNAAVRGSQGSQATRAAAPRSGKTRAPCRGRLVRSAPMSNADDADRLLRRDDEVDGYRSVIIAEHFQCGPVAQLVRAEDS